MIKKEIPVLKIELYACLTPLYFLNCLFFRHFGDQFKNFKIKYLYLMHGCTSARTNSRTHTHTRKRKHARTWCSVTSLWVLTENLYWVRVDFSSNCWGRSTIIIVFKVTQVIHCYIIPLLSSLIYLFIGIQNTNQYC